MLGITAQCARIASILKFVCALLPSKTWFSLKNVVLVDSVWPEVNKLTLLTQFANSHKPFPLIALEG